MNDTPTPHPTQILALFVMLLDALVVMLLDESKETHLVEMEAGKSLLVGLLATTLAVQGFEVHVACYTKVLSSYFMHTIRIKMRFKQHHIRTILES